MLKYVAIFAVILGMAVYIAVHDEHAAKYAAQTAAQQNNTAVPVKADEGHPQQGVPNSEENLPYWLSLFFRWPNGTTTWAIILTLFAIAEQTRHTAKAAEATGESVGAIQIQSGHMKTQTELLREQIDRMVEKERGRLNLDRQPIKIERGEEGLFYLVTCIELTNSGPSKVYILFGAGRFVVTTSGPSELPQPDPDDFSLGCNVIEPSNDPAYAGFFIDDIPLEYEDFAERLANGETKAYLYGFIDYETIGIKRHRDFGFVWTIEESRWNHIGRSSEDLIASGTWEESLLLKNGDYEIKAKQTENPN